MKKEYTTPVIEKIAFDYRDQVVAASSPSDSSSSGSVGRCYMENAPSFITSTPLWGICDWLGDND